MLALLLVGIVDVFVVVVVGMVVGVIVGVVVGGPDKDLSQKLHTRNSPKNFIQVS